MARRLEALASSVTSVSDAKGRTSERKAALSAMLTRGETKESNQQVGRSLITSAPFVPNFKR